MGCPYRSGLSQSASFTVDPKDIAMLLDASDSQLVLVDYQSRLMPAIHEGSQVLANAVRLARMARLLQVPVWGTEQNPAKLGPNDPAVREHCQKTLAKMDFSAVGAGLLDCLRPPVRRDGPRSATVRR